MAIDLDNLQYGDCREFKVTEQWNTKRYKNQSSTGVMTVLCRHDIVRPDCVVNLQKGERYERYFLCHSRLQ